MSLTKLSVELLEKIGGFLNTREANHYMHFTPPVNGIQGAFNQTIALRNYEAELTRFTTIAGMIHQDDLISGSALFYALSRAAPPHHILNIIERCPQALSTRDMNDNSVLHAAIKGKNRLEVLQLVCGAPEDWRSKKMAVNGTKMTPMHMALEARADYEVIEFLLDGGRDVLGMENTNGDFPLHCAIRNVAALRVVELLIETESGHMLMSQNQQGNLPLHLAGEFGVSERGVIAVLSRPEIHSDVRLKLNEDSHTPLYLAVSSKQDISILKLLMDSDKNVLTMGRPPLHLAVSKDASFEVTKLLIDADKKVLNQLYRGYYPFQNAIHYMASLEIMKLLLDDDWACIRTPTKDAKTALHIACERGSTFDVIQFLVEKDKTVLSRESNRNTYNQTPLHLALCNRRVCMPLESIACIANANPSVLRMVNSKKEMPLHVALINRLDVGIIEFLAKADRYPLTKKSNQDFTPLRLAVARHESFSMEYKSVIPLLIDDDEYVLLEEAPNYQHLPLLHFALQYRTEDSVPENFKMFIDKDERVLLYADYVTRYPLHVAIESGQNMDTLKLLLDDQKSILTRTPVRITNKVFQCFTPLHHFLKHSKIYDVETIMFLIDASKTVLMTPDKHGEMPLHYAIRHGSEFPHIIPRLIDKDRDCLSQCGPEGCPLQIAILCKWDVKMLRALVDPLGKVFRLRGKEENTPLHASVIIKSDDATVRFLVESDPYVLYIQNVYKYTPLHVAIDNRMGGLSEYYNKTNSNQYNEWNLEMLFLLGAKDETVRLLPNLYGQTPLFSAVARGFTVHVLEYLIDFEGSALRLLSDSRVMQRTPLQECICGRGRAMAEDSMRLLVEHVGGQDALILQDGDGNTPLHNAIQFRVSPLTIQFLAYKSMPPVCFGRKGHVIPTLEFEHALGMKNRFGHTPLHSAMFELNLVHAYDTVLYLVQIYPKALGIVSQCQTTPLRMAVYFVLKDIMPVSVLERLVRSYPQALLVNNPREGGCKFPLVYALLNVNDAEFADSLQMEKLIQVLGLLIDSDRVVMRKHGNELTPCELAVREHLPPRVVRFLLGHMCFT
jgi:ankyrin repeat protein